ncbi:MAG: hypothetical protein ACOYEV_15890 [Candidatus Nanopelagicales bacterium]
MIGGLETLVRFGGASGGLLGIEVRPVVWAIRVLFWAGSAALALVAALWRIRRSQAGGLLAGAAGASVVVGLVLVLGDHG